MRVYEANDKKPNVQSKEPKRSLRWELIFGIIHSGRQKQNSPLYKFSHQNVRIGLCREMKQLKGEMFFGCNSLLLSASSN